MRPGRPSVLILFMVLLSASKQSSVRSKVLRDVLRSLGWKRMVVVAKDRRTALRTIGEVGPENNIALTAATPYAGEEESEVFKLVVLTNLEDFGLFVQGSESKSSCASKAYSCLLSYSDGISDSLYTFLEHYNVSSAVFGLEANNNGRSVVWRLQTFKGQRKLVKNEVRVLRHGLNWKYDMQGAELTSVMLGWSPYIMFEGECRSEGYKDCPYQGIMADVAQSLEKTFNFTLRMDKDPENNWGSSSLLGNYSVSNGVMGLVEQGVYDMSFGPWLQYDYRAKHYSFSQHIFATERRITINLQNSPIDATLFFRPFTTRSWLLAFASCVLVALAFLLSRHSHRGLDKENAVSARILTFAGWILFIVLHAFYSGALTMFFASPPSLPFQNLREAVKHEDWKLFILKNEYRYLVVSGLQKTLDEILASPEERVAEDMEAAMQKLVKDAGTFFFPSQIKLLGHLSQNPLPDGTDIINYGDPQIEAQHVLFSKGNPNQRMFNLGIQRLRQSGALDVVLRKWIGGKMELSRAPMAATSVVEGSQVALGFIMLVFAYAATALVLAAEKLWKTARHKGDHVHFLNGSEVKE